VTWAGAGSQRRQINNGINVLRTAVSNSASAGFRRDAADRYNRSFVFTSNSAAKSAPLKIASAVGVTAAATSGVTEPKGVVLFPTTQPDVILKLSPAPRFEKITAAFAGAAIPVIGIPIAILIWPLLGC
jgi:hypothetical protein